MKNLDLQKWGPITVLAVATVLLVVGGGLLNVILGHETFHAFLDDLKWVAGALAAGAGVGRGLVHFGTGDGDIDTGTPPLAVAHPVGDPPLIKDAGDPGRA